MGSSLLRLENYRSYIIFVDLNYKAFQTFLYYIRLGDKLLVLLFKYNSRGKSLGNSMRSHNCWSKRFAFYSKEVPVVTARVVSRRGEKHGHGDASGGHGRPCILPETGTCKPLRAGAARHCGLQRGTAGCDGRSWGCDPQINQPTPLFAPPLWDYPVYYFDKRSVVKRNHICLPSPVPHSSTPFSSPQHLKEIFGVEESTWAFNTNNFKKGAFDEGLGAGNLPITLWTVVSIY